MSQIIVLIAWVFFRAPSVPFASHFIHDMFTPTSVVTDYKLLWLSIYALPLVFHHFAPTFMRLIGPSRMMPVLGVLTGLMLMTTLLVQAPPAVFIYFAF